MPHLALRRLNPVLTFGVVGGLVLGGVGIVSDIGAVVRVVTCERDLAGLLRLLLGVSRRRVGILGFFFVLGHHELQLVGGLLDDGFGRGQAHRRRVRPIDRDDLIAQLEARLGRRAALLDLVRNEKAFTDDPHGQIFGAERNDVPLELGPLVVVGSIVALFVDSGFGRRYVIPGCSLLRLSIGQLRFLEGHLKFRA
uniref:(northern house mosquito) hypothetical protein n=1 Tax=Culex pipiens TaxID=7175 RepID=A0A8D8H547_CULPI